MITLTAGDGTTIEVMIRKTEPLDAPGILQLSQPWTKSLFGRVDVVNIIEKAVFAVSLTKTTPDGRQLVAHAAFFDYPNVANVSQSEWESWINNFFVNTQYNALNVLFMNYFVAREDYTESSLRAIVRSVFSTLPDLNFIVLISPVNFLPNASIKRIFKALDKPEAAPCEMKYTIYECLRRNHVPVLHIRQARTEDHDDLTVIFGHHTDNLRATYGEYFLGELIEAQDENMKCLAAEFDDVAVGFMSLTNDVNLHLLNECFELAPYNGLCVPDANDIINPSQSVSANVKVVPKLTDTQPSDTPRRLISDTSISDTELKSVPSSSSPESDLTEGYYDSPSLSNIFIPTYFGASNAFSIQLFCIDEKHEMRSCDFLQKAFALFPDLAYIIMTVPHHIPQYPLIQNFLRVTPRCASTLPQELYIFHRSGLFRNFVVRASSIGDYDDIENLVKNIDLSEHLLQDLIQYYKAKRDADGTRIQAFVAECHKQIVGVAIVRDEQDIEYIRSHYNIEDYIYFNHHRREDHGHLHHHILNPIFNHYMRHFLREVLRLSHKTCLYYPVYPVYSSKETVARHSLICSLGVMVPVHPRRQIKYPVEQLGINAPSDRVLAEKLPYALYLFNCKLSLQLKVKINLRIVVVGASDVGLSFLETLVFCPHLCFNNLILVSPHGLPGEMPPDPLRDQMLPNRHSYSQEDFARISLRTWVNVVHGYLTSIDRSRKFILVDNSFKINYDYLVLTTGQQFQAYQPVGNDVDAGNISFDEPHDLDHRLLSEPPRNLYLLNEPYDAAVILHRAKTTMIECHTPIIIYGINLSAYCCIQSLLTVGIKGTNIVVVQPPSSKGASFEDLHVEEAVTEALQEAGVHVYFGYTLARWNGQVEIPDKIASASFFSESGPLHLTCQAFFFFIKKTPDYQALKAVNDACLVFDGWVVVDKSFRTTDPAILAAGPLTKLRRSYHAEHWRPAAFDSKEVGIDLATRMLCLFDPNMGPLPAMATDESINVSPTYICPHIVSAVLPGGYHYLEVSKPGVPEPSVQFLSLERRPCRELKTGTANSDQGYMKLGINRYQTVEKIVCLSRKKFPISNFICLYGIHQRALNNLVSRYDEGLITDFYSYFQDPWCMAIFHDRFPDVIEEIRELLVTSTASNPETMEQKVRDMLKEDVALPESKRELLMSIYSMAKSPKRHVETRILSYLLYNYYHLPMFARPGMV